MAKKTHLRWGTEEVREAMRQRYCAPQYAFFEEVGNVTGFGCSRHADAVSVSLWPSRGLEIHGYEIKVSRQDWVKDLKNPEKADEIAKYCDRWWVVLGDPEIVKDGELPPTWGLMVMQKRGLVQKVEAPKLEQVPLSRKFVAALLRRASESHDALVKEAELRGFDRGKKVDPVSLDEQAARYKRLHQQLLDRVREFEKESGIQIDGWSAPNVGAALRRCAELIRFEPDPVDHLKHQAEMIRNVAGMVDRELETFKKLRAEVAKMTQAQRDGLSRAVEAEE